MHVMNRAGLYVHACHESCRTVRTSFPGKPALPGIPSSPGTPSTPCAPGTPYRSHDMARSYICISHDMEVTWYVIRMSVCQSHDMVRETHLTSWDSINARFSRISWYSRGTNWTLMQSIDQVHTIM